MNHLSGRLLARVLMTGKVTMEVSGSGHPQSLPSMRALCRLGCIRGELSSQALSTAADIESQVFL